MQERNGKVSYAAVIGTGTAALRFSRKQNKKKRKRYHIVGFIGDENEKLPAPRLCALEDLASYLLSADVDEIIIAMDPDQVYLMPDIISTCENSGIRYSIFSARREPAREPAPDSSKMRKKIRASKRSKLGSPVWLFLKRAADLILSALLIIILLPVMLIIAIGVRFSGPVLVREKIVGMRRKSFTMIKFRSIEDVGELRKRRRRRDTEEADGKKDGENSVTSPFLLGLREHKLDMLPRLFNVLKGEMSFVGPNPEPRSLIAKYRDSMPGFMQRYRVRPGLTGWARVISERGDILFREEEWVRYDLWYVQNWSPRLDLSILKKTFFEKKTYQEAVREKEEKWKAALKAKKQREQAQMAAAEQREAEALESARRKAAEQEEKRLREAERLLKAEAKAEAKRIKEEEMRFAEEKEITVSETRRKTAAAEARARREEERRKAAKARREVFRKRRKETVELGSAAIRSVKSAPKRVKSQSNIIWAIAGHYGRPFLIAAAMLILLYYLCYRMDAAVSSAMFVPLKIVSTLFFIVSAFLTIKRKSGAQVILLFNLLWMILSRILLDDLTIGPHGAVYFAAMFFSFYSCGILLKDNLREYLLNIVTLSMGAILLLWAVAGFHVAFTGQTVKGLEMIRLQVEKTPALMTFISFFGTHRNISSTYFVILMGLFIYQVFRHRTIFWKIAAVIFVPTAYVMVAMQHSRSNYMAASVILTGALLSAAIDKATDRKKHVNALIVVAGAGLSLFIFFTGFYYSNKIVESLANDFRSEQSQTLADTGKRASGSSITLTDPRDLQTEIKTLNRRTDIWKASLTVMNEDPRILSVGRPEDLVMEAINDKLTRKKEPHMHHVFLQQLMVCGALGMLLYMWFFFTLFKSMYLSLRETKYRETVGNWVLGSILIALFVYGMLEPLLSPKIPFASLLFCLIAGCLDGELRKIRRQSKTRR